MAEKKTSGGFKTPTIGTLYPRGTRLRHNPDGTVTPILPKKEPVKKPKKK